MRGFMVFLKPENKDVHIDCKSPVLSFMFTNAPGVGRRAIEIAQPRERGNRKTLCTITQMVMLQFYPTIFLTVRMQPQSPELGFGYL